MLLICRTIVEKNKRLRHFTSQSLKDKKLWHILLPKLQSFSNTVFQAITAAPQTAFCQIKRAVDEARTRDPQLGKLMLYQLSYYRICGAKIQIFPESNNKSNKIFKAGDEILV